MNRRRLIALGAAAAASIAASCTALLSLDGKQDASDAICAMLTDCYGDASADDTCVARIGANVESDAGLVWLEQKLGSGACLDSCVAARACLDDVAFCHAYGATCQSRDECCHFVTGRAACEEGLCCATAGQDCGEGKPPCCASAGLCDPRTWTCGGTLCREPRAPCGLGDHCCSGTCIDRACSDQICADDNFGCERDEECCSLYCAEGHCGHPPCKPLGVGCAGDGECCAQEDGGPGICADVAGARLCSTGPTCFPLGSDCSDDGQCCSGDCDPAFLKCAIPCTDSGHACTLDGECCSGHCTGGECAATCSTSYCKQDSDCCGGTACILGTCSTSKCKAPTCTEHDPCTAGAPLQRSPACGGDFDTCIADVCKTDPFCCCNTWDESCVAEAKTLCPSTCKSP